MFCNGRPNRNRRYVPNVRYILDRIERLAISPKLNENKEIEMSTEKIEGDTEIFEEMGKEDSQEVYKDDLTYEGPTCPSCETTMQIHNGVEECPVCGYIIKDI